MIMKKQIISIISLLLISTEVIAQYCKINDIIYGLDSSNNTAFVTYDRAFNYYYSGDVNIPSEIEYQGIKYSVISIGRSAFEQCHEVKSVTIPNSVTNIEEKAFWGCI